MQSVVRHLLVFLLSLLCWTAGQPALAVYPPPVKDEGKFFKPATLEKADKKIRSIYQNYRKDVVVETFPSIPPELEKKFRADHKITAETLSKSERTELFNTWAKQREEELGLNGVYVLICKKPGHVHLAVDRETSKKAFLRRNEDVLTERLLKKFREREFDDGLLTGLDDVESALKANLK